MLLGRNKTPMPAFQEYRAHKRPSRAENAATPTMLSPHSQATDSPHISNTPAAPSPRPQLMPPRSCLAPLLHRIHDIHQLQTYFLASLLLRGRLRGNCICRQNMVGRALQDGQRMLQSARDHPPVQAPQLVGRGGRRDVGRSPRLLNRNHHCNYHCWSVFALFLVFFPRGRDRRGMVSTALPFFETDRCVPV